MLPTNRLRSLAAVVLAGPFAALLAAPTARAASYFWDIDGAIPGAGGATPSGLWSTGGTTWSTDATGATATSAYTTSSTDDLFFSAGSDAISAYTIGLTNAKNAGSLNFKDGSVTLSGTGGVVTLGGTGGNITVGTGLSAIIGANTSTAVGGSVGLTKLGAGTLALNGNAANSFTGGLNVSAGFLVLDYNNLATPTDLIAAANALQVNNGALTITGINFASATTAQTFASTSLGVGRNTINIAKGALATSATLNLGPLTANSGSSTIFSPTTAWTTTASTTEIVNIFAGGSVPSLPGSGTAFVNAGVFHRVAGGVNGTLRVAAVNSSGQLLLKANAGNLAVGTGVDPAGYYQLNAGSIALTNTGASVYGLLLNATGAGTNITLANSGTLTLNSVVQIKATESVNINAGTGASNVIIGSERNLVLAMDNTAGLTINAPVADNGAGASGVTIVGTASTGTPGAVAFGGANTYTGATNVHNTILLLANANALGGNSPGVNGTSAIIMTNGATLRTNQINGATTVYAPITTSGKVTINAPSVNNGFQTFNEFIINGAIGGIGNVTFNNVVNTNAILTVTLNSANNYSGTTTINNTAGTSGQMFVKLGVDNALPTTTILNILGNAGSGGGRGIGLNLFGFNQTLAGLTNTAATLRIQEIVNSDASAAATLTINGSTDTTYSGNLGRNGAGFSVSASTISGSTNGNNFGLTKNGTGTFTLTANNQYYGATKILGGILSLGSTGAVNQSPLDTLNSITGDATNGLRTTMTSLSMGGLTGNKDLATVFTTTSGGYSGLTALTLNPVSGANHSYSGDIGNGAGALTVTKTGPGTQILSGTQAFTGATNVTDGTLRISGSIAGSIAAVSGTGRLDLTSTGFAGVIAVNSGGTLAGTGAAGAVTLNAGGTLAPGASPGIFTASSTDFNGGTFALEITGPVAGTGYDQLSTGALSLTSDSPLTLNLGAFDPADDGSMSFLVINNTGLAATTGSGRFTFNGTPLNNGDTFTAGVQMFSITYNGGTNANDVILTAVPEPSAAVALLSGTAMLLGLRRRRRTDA